MGTRKSLLLASTAVATFIAGAAGAGAQQPTGGKVASGAATISQSAKMTTVNQSSKRAIINWEGFSLGAGKTAQFNLPSSNSAVLNRVVGSSPSQLLGNIRSNGQVYLVNPHGVVVGNGARIETNRFVASTLDVSNAEFMAGGAMRFRGSSENAVVNQGEIVSGAGGVALLARKVSNSGQIRAEGGTASLAAGSEILLQADNSVVAVAAPSLTQLAQAGVDNNGLIEAARTELRAYHGNAYGLAVNNSGVIRASGMESRDGRVFLTGGSVANSGLIEAQRADRGGDVVIAGDEVALAGTAKVSASGRQGGGTVKVGGGWQGKDAEVVNAQKTTVAAGAVIEADATKKGDGGTVVVWSDGRTDFEGRISARGGSQGGNGGNVEVSGKQVLAYDGLADLRAPKGKAGTLLLDPYDVTIWNGFTFDNDCTSGSCTPSDNSSRISVVTLENQLALGDVEILTTGSGSQDGDIRVLNDFAWNTNSKLTLKAEGDIEINANIGAGKGTLRLEAGLGGTLASYRIESASNTAIYVDRLELNARQFTDTYLNGIVDVNTLDLDYFGGGYVFATNDGNLVNNLVFSGTTTNGSIRFYNGSSHLTVSGNSGPVGGNITIRNTGDLTMAAGTMLDAITGEVALISTKGKFTNLAGEGLIGEYASRYRIYAADESGSNLGGLKPDVVHGVSFPDDPKAGNVFYVGGRGGGGNGNDNGNGNNNDDRDDSVAEETINRSYRDQAKALVSGGQNLTKLSQEDFNAAIKSDPWGKTWLSVVEQNWPSEYGRYDEKAVLQFALALCGHTEGCTNPSAAMMKLIEFLQANKLNAAVVAAYPQIVASDGWGKSYLGNSAVQGMTAEIWNNLSQFSNLTNMATILDGLRSQLQPGEPGYGQNLVTLLKNIGNESSSITKGVQAVLLHMKAEELMTKNPNLLTPAEKSFSDAIVMEMIKQAEQTLNKVKRDYEEHVRQHTPTSSRPNMAMLFDLGVKPTEQMKNELLTLTPQEPRGSIAFQETATASGRLLAAIGTEANQVSEFTEQFAGGLLGASGSALGGTLVAISATVTVAGAKGGAVGAAGILGLSAAAAKTGAVTAGAVASAAMGPVIIGAAAVALIAGGISHVVEINEFKETIATIENIIEVYKKSPPSLATMMQMPPIGSAANMQYSIINLLTSNSGGFVLLSGG